MFSEAKKCRICSSKKLEKYLSLGEMPLANNLVSPKKKDADQKFPLEVLFCHGCKLSLLSIVVKPEILFSEYAYRTSVSSTFQKHFEEFGKEAKNLFPHPEKPVVLDIGSNDGCLLEGFQKQGFRVLGVEPAKNLAIIANQKGIRTYEGFWNAETAKKIVQENGKIQMVTATNVFAHIDDVHGFVLNVRNVLSGEGVFAVEVPYALNLVQKNEFDTVYHEHLSYFLVKPLLQLLESEKMAVFDIQKIPTHGGSIRVFAKKTGNKKIPVQKEKLEYLLAEEEQSGLYDIAVYKKFAEKTVQIKKEFVIILEKLKKENKKVAGFAASAKASTLLHYCSIGKEHISFIVDDAKEKQGKCLAGNRIPVVSREMLEKEKPDFLVIFAWNIAKEIIQKTNSHRERGGKYIIPMPFPKIVENEKEL